MIDNSTGHAWVASSRRRTRRLAAAIVIMWALYYLGSASDAQTPGPSQVGHWSNLIGLPMVGVHLVVMPTGKVLIMSAETQVAGAGAKRPDRRRARAQPRADRGRDPDVDECGGDWG